MIHHVALFARDPSRLAAFYGAALNLPEIRRNTDENGLYSVWLGSAKSVLMIERADNVTAHDEKPVLSAGPGLRPAHHCLVAFSVEQGEEIAFRDRLANAGGSISHRTESTLYFTDPEGNRAAVSWHRFAT